MLIQALCHAVACSLRLGCTYCNGRPEVNAAHCCTDVCCRIRTVEGKLQSFLILTLFAGNSETHASAVLNQSKDPPLPIRPNAEPQ